MIIMNHESKRIQQIIELLNDAFRLPQWQTFTLFHRLKIIIFYILFMFHCCLMKIIFIIIIHNSNQVW